MLFRSLLATLALAVAVAEADAQRIRRSQPTYQRVSQPPVFQPTYQPVYQPMYSTPTIPPGVIMPASGTIISSTPTAIPASGTIINSSTPTVLPTSGTIITNSTPVVTSSGEYVSNYSPTVTSTATTPSFPTVNATPVNAMAGDGLAEVNAQRARRGLRPFLRDEGLMQAARACAQYRANHGLFGHTSNDFAFVPAGTSASSAGCAAYPAGYGWMSCCTYDNYTYAGAAYATGRDGKRYMHLFVR